MGVGGSALAERLFLNTVLHYASGFSAHSVADNIDRVVNFVGGALALSVAGIVASLLVAAVVVRRQRL
jgi:hypothetical protein